MPALIPWIALGGLGVLGIHASKGTMDSASNLVKWSAIAGGVYVAGKYTKAW